jgi:CBS domain-containing protein
MSTEVATLSPETTVEQAARDLVQNRVTGMPVVGYDGTVVGVLSLTDVATALAGEGPADPPVADDAAFFDPVKLDKLVRSLDADDDASSGKTVADSMSRRLVIAPASATVAEAAAMMARYRVHRVLVIDDAGKLAGILTSMDVVAVVGAP